MILTACTCVLLFATGDAADAWPQWRGRTRDGMVAGPSWPSSLKEDVLRRVWRVELGDGYSGPIVFGERVFVAETRDRKDEVVTALERKSGKQLWQASWPGAMTVPFFAMRNGSWIRSTPACDGESLFVGGMRDLLVCLDVATGAVRWQLDLANKYSTALESFGFVCSPLVDGEHLYVQCGAGTLKLDKKSGAQRWRAMPENGGMMDGAFSSPVIAELCGKRQLVVQTRQKLCGIDLDDGAVLWSQAVPSFRGMNILTPTIVAGDRIFTSSHSNKSYLYRIVRIGDQWSVEQLWANKQSGYMSSPVAINGHVYLHLQNRRVSCIDLATGKSTWTTTPFGEYWSLAAQADRILALDNRGELFLFQADPEQFRLLDSRKICDQEAWAHLAVAGDEIFIREQRGISAYRWSK